MFAKRLHGHDVFRAVYSPLSLRACMKTCRGPLARAFRGRPALVLSRPRWPRYARARRPRHVHVQFSYRLLGIYPRPFGPGVKENAPTFRGGPFTVLLDTMGLSPSRIGKPPEGGFWEWTGVRPPVPKARACTSLRDAKGGEPPCVGLRTAFWLRPSPAPVICVLFLELFFQHDLLGVNMSYILSIYDVYTSLETRS